MEGLILDRESLGPLGSGVQAVAVEALKCGEPNIRVDERAIEWFRLDGDGLRLRLREDGSGSIPERSTRHRIKGQPI